MAQRDLRTNPARQPRPGARQPRRWGRQPPPWAQHALASRPHHPRRAAHLSQLADAVGPMVPDDDGKRVLLWLAGWDQPTVGTIARLIQQSRSQNRWQSTDPTRRM